MLTVWFYFYTSIIVNAWTDTGGIDELLHFPVKYHHCVPYITPPTSRFRCARDGGSRIMAKDSVLSRSLCPFSPGPWPAEQHFSTRPGLAGACSRSLSFVLMLVPTAVYSLLLSSVSLSVHPSHLPVYVSWIILASFLILFSLSFYQYILSYSLKNFEKQFQKCMPSSKYMEINSCITFTKLLLFSNIVNIIYSADSAMSWSLHLGLHYRHCKRPSIHQHQFSIISLSQSDWTNEVQSSNAAVLFSLHLTTPTMKVVVGRTSMHRQQWTLKIKELFPQLTYFLRVVSPVCNTYVPQQSDWCSD